MIFTMENLGCLASAEIELKKLTILCGKNNTGKTYATYAIYGFLRAWGKRYSKFTYELMNGEFGILEVDRLNEILNAHCLRYAAKLSDVFASSENVFEDAAFRIKETISINLQEREYREEYPSTNPNGKTIVITKAIGESFLRRNGEIITEKNNRFFREAADTLLLNDLFPNAFIASTERTGTAIFRRELDFARSKIFDIMGKPNAKELIRDPFELMRTLQADYAWPVQDDADFARSLESLKKHESPLIKHFPDILKGFEEIIGGSFNTDSEFIQFTPFGTENQLSLNESSSCVRALLSVGFYLRHRAKPGDLLMIDEPELSLHPANQRKFARLLARLVNCGMKVFITTHSDYIVKEFNTLIMMNEESAGTQAIKKQFNYTSDEKLSPDDVGLYMTQEVPSDNATLPKKYTMVAAQILPGIGIEVPTFDDTIEEMNAIQNALQFGGVE